MTAYPKGISVGCTAHEVFVTVVGRGTFQNSQSLRSFALDMIGKGRHQFVVDLGRCVGIDSTFLGVLAGLGLRLQQNGSPGKVHIVNANARNTELLQTLGLDRLFHVAGSWEEVTGHAQPEAVAQSLLPDSDPESVSRTLNKTRMASVMLEAHENLIQADKNNEKKFKDITRLLREDLSRSKKQDST